VPVAHYENFPVASFVVPRELRGAVTAIYRFARAADDVADEGDTLSSERIAALDRFEAALDAIAAGDLPALPPFADLADVVRRHQLPLAPFRELLSAFRQDVTTSRYPTAAALFDYCGRSANPIGRLLLHLYGAPSPSNVAWSDAICTGLQLVNFWQDIALDWRIGRIYLPQEDLERFGVSEAQIAAARCDERWRALLAFETARARSLIDAGRPLVRALPWRVGLELAGVLAGAQLILERIDLAGGDVFRRRPLLGGMDWAKVSWRALFPAAT
jgi:squalene synthase HpnC